MHGSTLRRVVRAFRLDTPATPRLTKVLQLYCELAAVDPDTIKRNARVFRHFIRVTGNQRTGNVTKLMAAQFQARLSADGKAKATIKSYCASVSSVFGWAVENVDSVGVNPFKGLKRPKLDKTEPTYFTRDEMDRLYGAIEALDWRDPILRLQWWAILLVADTCGFRIGEILNVRWDDIDLDGRLIKVRHRPHMPGECWEWGTKGHRDRFMPIPDDLLALLYRMKQTCPWRYPFLKERRCLYLQENSGSLSDSTRKRPYTNLYETWKRIRATANVKGDGAFHDVRRLAATELAPDLSAQELKLAFGWQSLSTAEFYLGTCDCTQKEAVARAQANRAAKCSI